MKLKLREAIIQKQQELRNSERNTTIHSLFVITSAGILHTREYLLRQNQLISDGSTGYTQTQLFIHQTAQREYDSEKKRKD